MSYTYETCRLTIPHPLEPDIQFSGILEQVLNRPEAGRRLAVVSFSINKSIVLTWGTVTDATWCYWVGPTLSSQMSALMFIFRYSHKDNLYQRPLARRLPIHSFRFDLR